MKEPEPDRMRLVVIGSMIGMCFGLVFTFTLLVPAEANRDNETGLSTLFFEQTCFALFATALLGAIIGWHYSKGEI